MCRSASLVFLLAAACSPAPEPKAAGSGEVPQETGAGSSDEGRRPDAHTESDAGDESTRDAGAGSADSAPAEPAYREPPPIVVRRHHVFATLNARAGKRVTLTSLLTTASDDHPDLEAGTEATLQQKPKGKTEWSAIGTVKVISVSTKGSRAAGTERQEIAVELLSEVPQTKASYARGTQLRLQVDRPEKP